MRYCQSCGKEQDDDAVFCGNCGAKLDPIDADVEESTQEHSGEELASENEAEQESTNTDDVASSADSTSVESASVGETTDAANRSSETTDKVQDALEAQKTEQAQQTQVAQSTQQTQRAQPTQQTESDTKGKGLSRNRLIGIIIAAIVVVIVVVIILVVALGGNSGPSEETVENDFKDTSYFKDGIVPSNYVNESPYELDDFSIDVQDEQPNDTECTVEFSGTMKNDNFSTTILSGKANYTKKNGSWVLADSGFHIDRDHDSKSEPLKGVDSFEEDSSKETCEDFEATFQDEGNDEYKSVATGTVTYEYWYATDTATKTQTFTFNSKEGWVLDGDPELNNPSTSWDPLVGKTFEFNQVNTSPTSMESTYASLAFIEGDEEYPIKAQYKILYDPPESASDNLATYRKVDPEGNAISTNVKHNFGEDNFSFELKDAEDKDVTFTCKKGSDQTTGGDIVKHTMAVNLTTNEAYRVDSYGHSLMLNLINIIFVESVSS